MLLYCKLYALTLLFIASVDAFRIYWSSLDRLNVANAMKSVANDDSGQPAADRLEQTVMSLKEKLQNNPFDEPALFNLAMILHQIDLQEGGRDSGSLESLRLFERAASLNEDRDATWYNIATISESIGSYERALEAYNKAIEVTRSDAVALASYNNMASLYMQSNMLEEAAQISDAAVNAYPLQPSVWCTMGVILREAKSNDWSKVCLEKAVELIRQKQEEVANSVDAGMIDSDGSSENTNSDTTNIDELTNGLIGTSNNTSMGGTQARNPSDSAKTIVELDPSVVSTTYNNLAYLEDLLGNTEKAQEYLRLAAEVDKSLQGYS